LELFYETLKKQNVEVLHVNWKPPAGGDIKLARILKDIL
jgi:hypothetical protein